MSFVSDMDILLEEEADKQRVVEENQLARYVAIVKEQQAEAQRAREEQDRVEMERQQQEARKQLANDMERKLRLSVSLERVRIEHTGDFGEWYPAVEFGGVTFALRHMNSRSGGISYKIHIAQPCVRCERPTWSDVAYPADLAYELEREHMHDFNCVDTPDEDAPLPDDNLVAEPSPVERYTAAIKRRRELQFERGKEKEFAIRRIVANKGVTFNGESFVAGSATAAEKLVEFDEGYAAICAALTDAVIAEIGAREALRAAGGNPKKEDEEV